MEYEQDEQNLFLIGYHLFFCSKRKSKVLVGPVRDRLDDIISEVLQEHQWRLLALTIDPDHVYLTVQGHPQMAPAEIVRLIKWRSAHVLRTEFPVLKRLPSLWTKATLYSTEEVPRDVLAAFVEKQPKI